jgi:hypothetical protein
VDTNKLPALASRKNNWKNSLKKQQKCRQQIKDKDLEKIITADVKIRCIKLTMRWLKP